MKFLKIIIALLLICNIASAETADIYVAYNTSMTEVENLFKQNVKPDGQMIFTYVPRGLIISIDENVFFNENNEKIRQSGAGVLNDIGNILNEIGAVCVIEGHTERVNPEKTSFKTNWELSLARANNIARYLMRCLKVKPEKIVSMGFGEFMPFIDNVSESADLNNRIDFVILHYDANR